MVVPLLHSVLPVAASSTCRTAGTDRCARCAAVSGGEAGPRYSPLETAKTMPFTTIGASGDATSCDCQPGASDSFPPSSITLNATMRPDDAGPFCVNVTSPVVPDAVVKIQRPPLSSWNVASAVPAPAAVYFAVDASGVL